MNTNKSSGIMKNKTIVRLGSLQDKESQTTIPAFFVIRPTASKREAPVNTLLVSLNLPLDQINKELQIFNQFVTLWIEYAQASGYEFEFDQQLFEKTDQGWRAIEG